jgi:hypothetical protein
MFSLTPVVCPDSGRLFSVCSFQGCYAPRSGVITQHATYGPLQVDTLLSFDVYNMVNGEGPVDSAVVGDYLLRAAIYPADNAGERVEYDLRLNELHTAAQALAVAGGGFHSLPAASLPQYKWGTPR